MLYRPFIITRRGLITGAAAIAIMPRDARAAATAWDNANLPASFFLSNSNLTVTFRPKVLTFAADISGKKFWVHDSLTGYWNNDVLTNQNPATGTGGYTPSPALNAGPYYAAMSLASTGSGDAVQTFNFGTLIGLSMPSGFSTYNSAAGATATLDTSFNSNTGVTYSNGNLTVSLNSGTISTPSTMRASHSVSSGYVCWQVILHDYGTARWGLCNGSVANSTNIHNSSSDGWAVGPTTNFYLYNGAATATVAIDDWDQFARTIFATNKVTSGKAMFQVNVTRPDFSTIGIGVGNSSASGVSYVGNTNSWGYISTTATTSKYYNGGAGASADNVGTSGSVGIYVDFGNQRLWYYVSATSRYNDSATADPATNTGGIDVSGIISGGLYPLIGTSDTLGADVTDSAVGAANFAGSFTVPVPSGFVAWDNALSSNAKSQAIIIQ